MKSGIIIAVSLSILMVGGAFWTRSNKPEITNSLTLEQKQAKDNYETELFADFYQPSSTASTVSNEQLTNTDLISRQLIMDYLDLASKGGAGQETLDALAEQYAESIPTLSNSPKANYLDLKLTTDTNANLQAYSQTLGQIYMVHSKQISAAFSLGQSLTEGPEFTKFAKNTAEIYKKTARDLITLSVPKELAEFHLELINKHLSSAAALESMLTASSDPMTAMSGLIAMRGNADEELVILQKIGDALTSHGI